MTTKGIQKSATQVALANGALRQMITQVNWIKIDKEELK